MTDNKTPLSERQQRIILEWGERWNTLKYLVLALRKLILWVGGVGVAILVWRAILHDMTGSIR